ncbi:NAD(P)H-dependent flavin oxidoreductase [Bacillus solitudinis]|uniref:NAD(P)H-dependent flavin oxidoreductase n=1 Tax=Bacillus solitudinis TaxID=2014074 RepID=UPI000C24473B|nr:nitronate monooxygenase [Bacillus solitudinis]
MMWETKITTMLGITFPIIQGGLAYLAYADLAAAVSNAGGLGQITAMSLQTPGELKREIKSVREKTKKPFGVNFAIGQHGRPYEEMLDVAIEEKVPVVSVTGGNPESFFQRLQGTEIKKLVLVSSSRQALKAEELGADAVMVVGYEGGGHLGRTDTSTMVLVPQVVDAVTIPVLASGGITDGRSMMAALALGAEGIEMGTRFIATKECIHAHSRYKQMIIDASEEDTVVIKKSIGAPARALKMHLTNKILALEAESPTYNILKQYISAEANKAFIYDGNEEDGFGWAGQAIGRINDIPSVQELFERIMDESDLIRERLVNFT